MELAYRLAVSEQPMIRDIRKNLVVLINPVSEPDGRDKMVDWFYRFLKGKTDYDNLPENSPPYWGHYVFHDNNRDTHQKALQLTQAVHRMFYDYHPTVVHDLHESIPAAPHLERHRSLQPEPRSDRDLGVARDVLPRGAEPDVARHAGRLDLGLRRVVGPALPRLGRHEPQLARPRLRDLRQQHRRDRGADAAAGGEPLRRHAGHHREWYRPWPPDKKFRWSLRNNTNYMQTGCLAILDWSSKNAKDMLRNFYRKGYNSWQKGVKGNPYAFVIPQDQGDPRRVAQMVEVLRGQRIEVARLAEAVTVKEGDLREGRLRGPPRPAVPQLRRGPPRAAEVPDRDAVRAVRRHVLGPLGPLRPDGGARRRREDQGGPGREADRRSRGDGEGDGRGPGVPAEGHGAGGAARRAVPPRRGSRCRSPRRPSAVGSATIRPVPGSCPRRTASRPALDAVAKELGLDFESAGAAPKVATHEAPIPRVAVWHLWADTESVGWLRLALDQEKVPYDYIRDEEIRAGGLRDKYDVILYGNNSSNLKNQILGLDTRWGPMPYTKTPEFPSHGVPDASEDITGGIGWKGMANLQDYVERGGLLITLGNGSALALEGGLARNVNRSGTSVDTPGVELTVKFLRPDHPVAYGYPALTSAFRSSFPIYAVRPEFQRFVVLQWGTKLPKRDRDPDAPKPAATDKAKETEPAFVLSGGVKKGDDLEGAARDPRPAGGKGPRARLQLQPDAPGPQPLGLSIPVERDPELERAAARAAVRTRSEAMKTARTLGTPRRRRAAVRPPGVGAEHQSRLPRSLPADGAEELRGLPRLVEQRGLELERRQQAADPGRDDGPRRPHGARRRDPHLDDDRRQRVRLAAAPAPARLLRRQPDAERRRADRRLLRGRPRLRGEGQVADGRQQLRRPRPQLLLADAVPEVLPDHRHQRGPAPRREPLLPRRLGEAPVASRRTRRTSTRATGSRCRRRPTDRTTSS